MKRCTQCRRTAADEIEVCDCGSEQFESVRHGETVPVGSGASGRRGEGGMRRIVLFLCGLVCLLRSAALLLVAIGAALSLEMLGGKVPLGAGSLVVLAGLGEAVLWLGGVYVASAVEEILANG